MKYGITVSTMATEKRPATFGDGRAVQHFPGIRALGFHGVDLFIKPMPANELDMLKECLDSSGLEASVIFPVIVFESGMSLSDPGPENRKKAVRMFKGQIDVAAELKAKIVLGLSRGNPMEGEPESAFQDRFAHSMLELSDHAVKKSVDMLMEPIHRFLIGTFHRVEQCLEFFERYNLPSIQLLLDTFHMNIEERSIEGAIRLAGPRIGHVHAVDNNRGAPGDGHLDFVSIIAALRDVGYNEYLSVETQPESAPFDTARRGITVLRKIVNSLNAGT